MKHLMVLLLASILLPATGAWAWAEKRASLGGMDGFVERMGAGVKALGMGNAQGADPDGGVNAFANPALLAYEKRIQGTLGLEQRALGRTGSAFALQAGVGNRMGIGGSFLWRGVTDFKVIDEDDQDLGYANPYFYMAYVGLGWKLNRRDLIGMSFSKSGENYDLKDLYGHDAMLESTESPLAYNLGWFRAWNNRFETGVVVRNLGFNDALSARWTRSTSTDNSLPTSYAIRPKSIEFSQNYKTKFLQQPLTLRFMAIDYQIADTLLVFDPDWHVWIARLGAEWEAVEGLQLRCGYDAGDYSLGASMKVRKEWWVHYAFVFEGRGGVISPLAIGATAKF